MFRTEISIEPTIEKISLRHPILSIGSCFAGVIGQRLLDHKFNALVNPFGTLYNPAAIFRLLQDSINTSLPSDESYLHRQDRFYNFKFHSNVVAESRAALEETITIKLQSTREYLKHTRWIIITLGTALCYERQDNGQIVANCHKMPSSLFRQRMLSPEEISIRFDQLYLDIKALNEQARFIFTVSPVRHLRDTLVRNAASKASLRLGIEQITHQYPQDVQYFPSYELMMDDLRDYRFYAADMIHPNEVAQDYIWEKWWNTYLDEQAIEFLLRWEKIHRAMQHRAFQPASEEHQRFVRKTIEQLTQLSKVVDVSEELKRMKKQLS